MLVPVSKQGKHSSNQVSSCNPSSVIKNAPVDHERTKRLESELDPAMQAEPHSFIMKAARWTFQVFRVAHVRYMQQRLFGHMTWSRGLNITACAFVMVQGSTDINRQCYRQMRDNFVRIEELAS